MRDVAVVVSLGLSVVLFHQRAIAGAPAQISTDPYTNADSQHQTQVEPATLAYGTTVVAAFQSGRFFDGGCSNIGWATSEDSGSTWTNGFLPATTVNSIPPGPFARISDPSVAYDAKHNVWLIATLAIDDALNGAAVLVSRSSDGGLTWDAPVTVSAAIIDSYDKDWIVCDNNPASPFFGHCYATWDNGTLQILMSTSTDGGQTWSPYQAPRRAVGLGGQPVVQPSGHVIVPAFAALTNRIIAFRSHDGGGHWSPARKVATVIGHDTEGSTGLRDGAGLPSAAVDGAGNVYVTWSDCRFRAGCTANDLVLSTSANGIRWSRHIERIPIDPVTSGVDHFIPGLAVDPSTSGSAARLALTYYYYADAACTTDTCQLYAGFVTSNDGGATWSTPQTLGGPISLSWLANTDQGYMVGDYISTSFAGTNVVGVFAAAGAPAGSLLQESMFAYTSPETARRPAASLRTTADPVRSFTSDRQTPRASLTAH